MFWAALLLWAVIFLFCRIGIFPAMGVRQVKLIVDKGVLIDSVQVCIF